jgi:branched-chain amino acid aminotransferase
MVQLQRPPFVFMNGKLTPWDEARIHVASEALIRGISVFEGIKGYWSADGRTFSLLNLQDHYVRLCQSALMVHLPFEMDYSGFKQACLTLVQSLLVPGKDLWLRPTIYALEGSWGLDTVTDLTITAYSQEMKRPGSLNVGISTWQRPSDVSQPARIKSAANYLVSRNARIDGRRHGYDEMVLLNPVGRVAEGTGSAILISRNGQVITPPASEGCLESITVKITEKLCAHLGTPFVVRPIDKTELYIADEICFAGTLLELAQVKQMEFRALTLPGPVFQPVTDAFWRAVRGELRIQGIDLTPANSN